MHVTSRVIRIWILPQEDKGNKRMFFTFLTPDTFTTKEWSTSFLTSRESLVCTILKTRDYATWSTWSQLNGAECAKVWKHVAVVLMIVVCYTYLAVNNYKVIEIMRNETDRYMDIMYIYIQVTFNNCIIIISHSWWSRCLFTGIILLE